MNLQYIHLIPEEAPPPLAHTKSCAVIITEVSASESWRERTTEWLVQIGCLYAVAWGRECEKWHDSVDGANLREFDFGVIPEERFVMTTWHENDALREAFWFAGQCAFHPPETLTRTIILHVSGEPREVAVLQEFRESQTRPNAD